LEEENVNLNSIVQEVEAAKQQQATANVRASAQTTGSSASTSSSSGSSTTADATITADDFLTLLVSELQNQDPTADTDPNEYVDQLVDVNSLQQLISINQEVGRFFEQWCIVFERSCGGNRGHACGPTGQFIRGYAGKDLSGERVRQLRCRSAARHAIFRTLFEYPSNHISRADQLCDSGELVAECEPPAVRSGKVIFLHQLARFG
jgi:hypothetical protein